MSYQTNPLHGPIRVALQNMPLSKIMFLKKKKEKLSKMFLQIVILLLSYILLPLHTRRGWGLSGGSSH